MKRTIFLAVVAVSLFATSSVMANTTQKAQIEISDEVTYEEITAEDLPSAVIDAVKKDFAGGVIAKAYKGSDANYKVVVTVNGADQEVVYNKEGEKI